MLLRPLVVAPLLALALALGLVFFQRGRETPDENPTPGAGGIPAAPEAGGSRGQDGGMSRREFSRALEKLETNGDFAAMVESLQARRQSFSAPSEYTSRFSRLFEAWFAKDMPGAIAGVGMVPEDDSGSFPLSGAELRAEALLGGGVMRIPEAPEVFMEAADDLLPEKLRNRAYGTIVQELAAADPARCLQLVETSFGQGWLKDVAIQNLFSIWPGKNLEEAVTAASGLDFPEDRRRAYETVALSLFKPREEQIRMLEEHGLPADLVAQLREQERARRKIHGDPPPNQTGP